MKEFMSIAAIIILITSIALAYVGKADSATYCLLLSWVLKKDFI